MSPRGGARALRGRRTLCFRDRRGDPELPDCGASGSRAVWRSPGDRPHRLQQPPPPSSRFSSGDLGALPPQGPNA